MALTDKLANEGHGIVDGLFGKFAVKSGLYVATLTDNVTLDDTYPSLVKLDPGGSARDVTLDGTAATDAAEHGVIRYIVNAADAAENLVLKDAAGSTIATVNQNESALVYHDKDAGWTLIAVIAIALS